ncbi:hypothetical protein B484DRAFT_401281, partial [Ochromonadaceae sp. CCMP2298]
MTPLLTILADSSTTTKMFRFIAIACIAAVATANVQPREFYEKAFFEHMGKFKLTFATGAEFIQRLNTFAANFDLIIAHNGDKTNTYTMGLNKFSHLTHSEFLDEVKIGGARAPNLRKNGKLVHAAPADMSTLPDSIDWSEKGAVTGVKNQGGCGSCWSFSATGSLEGAYFLKYGSLLAFSEQELVSCDVGGGDAGCNGGWMDDAFDFVKSNGGLTTEDQYPYTSGTTGQSGSCSTTGYTNNANV